MIIRKKAYSRAALIGNPSDGYFGKTIAFTFDAFFAEATLYQTPELEIRPSKRDNSVFSSIEHLSNDVNLFGYYGGIRLLKAAIKVFHRYCSENGIHLHNKNFTLHYNSTIPHLVGLAGSSAIITACFRALMEFYDVSIELPVLANLILSVEQKELSISAGLQDRVAQSYGKVVYMDFDKKTMEHQGYGNYIPIDPESLPPLYIAYRTDLSQESDVYHNNLRHRFNQGEKAVVEAMSYWADLTEQARILLSENRGDELGELLNLNFDRRAQLYNINEKNLEMIETARSIGASAKFTGSGGAVIGTYSDNTMFEQLRERFESMNVRIIKPAIV